MVGGKVDGQILSGTRSEKPKILFGTRDEKQKNLFGTKWQFRKILFGSQRVNSAMDDETFEAWIKHMTKTSVTFQFLNMIIKLEKLILIVIKVYWQNEFNLYVLV